MSEPPTMPVRDAILAAADSIERTPDGLSFITCEVAPPNCGTQMCAIGWILAHEGSFLADQHPSYRFSTWDESSAEGVLGVEDSDFYKRMDVLQGFAGDGDGWDTLTHWARHGANCALMLRKYADTYHPAPAVAAIQPELATEQSMAAPWVKDFSIWASSPAPETSDV